MELQDTLPFPAVTLCPRVRSTDLPYDYSGVFSPMEESPMNLYFPISNFWKPSGEDARTEDLTDSSEDVNTITSGDEEKTCVTPFQNYESIS